jgi:hypothetical protein
MTRIRFSQIFLILLLLIAQQSAFTHAAWHAREHAPAPEKHHDDVSLQGELCALHGAFSQVLGGLQTPAVHRLASPGAAETCAHRSGAPVTLDLLLPHSRGPPVLS